MNRMAKNVDTSLYEKQLQDFLPPRIIDVHTHIWLEQFKIHDPAGDQVETWADQVASQNTLDELLLDYQSMLPRQQVTPVLFGYPSRAIDTEANNQWVSNQARLHGFPALLVSRPEMSPDQLAAAVHQGVFLGIKPYLDFAPQSMQPEAVTIYDFLPREQLELADENGWVVMLHIPRPGRLRDPLNLAQLLEIERNYPGLRLIIAHLGRAYCPQDLGDAMKMIRQTERMFFDFSANTCSEVMTAVLRTVGSQRVVFGSDMPITRMRMRRICVEGMYLNLVPPGIYRDVHRDAHMQEVSLSESDTLSYFLYEELLAFRAAAEVVNLTTAEIEQVFWGNAASIFFPQHEG